MRTTTILSIALSLVMAGCRTDNKNSSDYYVTINVGKDYPDKTLVLQDFMEAEYIPLETTDDFITHGNVLDVGENFILVRNRVNDGNIFIFDRKTGKGIRKINRLGQGAEEYPGMGGVILDEDNDELFVTHTGKISVYDLNGLFKRSFNFVDTESDYLKVYNYDKDNLITYNNKGYGISPDLQPYHLIISKQDGSLIREIKTPSKENKTLVIVGDNGEKAVPIFDPTTRTSDGWVLMNLSSDTLYTYQPDGQTKPFIVRTPSIHSMKTEMFLFVIGVTSRYYFLRTVEKKLDKKTGKIPVNHLAYDKQEDTLFKYEILNADFIDNKPVYLINAINRDIVNWFPLDAAELTEAYREGKLNKGRLYEIAANLNEESNPVIMLCKYKK